VPADAAKVAAFDAGFLPFRLNRFWNLAVARDALKGIGTFIPNVTGILAMKEFSDCSSFSNLNATYVQMQIINARVADKAATIFHPPSKTQATASVRWVCLFWPKL
jgi:hypothetical protein